MTRLRMTSVRVAVICDTGKVAVPKEAVEAAIQRPAGIDRIRVLRVEEFAREHVDVEVSQRQRIAGNRHVTSLMLRFG